MAFQHCPYLRMYLLFLRPSLAPQVPPCIQVPHTHRAVAAPTDHEPPPHISIPMRPLPSLASPIPVPICTKLQTQHASCVTLGRHIFSSASSDTSKAAKQPPLQAPYLDRTVARASDDTLRVELETVHTVCVALDREDLRCELGRSRRWRWGRLAWHGIFEAGMRGQWCRYKGMGVSGIGWCGR